MSATQAFGWALIHFLWQGAFVAAVLAVLLRFTRSRAPTVRYALGVIALITLLLLPIATTFRIYASAERSELRTANAPALSTPFAVNEDVASADRDAPGAPASVARRESSAQPLTDARGTASVRGSLQGRLRAALGPIVPWLVPAWFAGVLLLSMRLIGGITRIRRFTRERAKPATAAVVATLSRIAAQLNVRRSVRVLESALVEVPAVVGWLRPVVLVPASALVGLTPQQLELILAHELAHVRRHDYAINLAQTIVETLLFYHPAVWWVSKKIREERENCCDDIAVSITGDRRLYANALIGMERLRSRVPSLAAAATGGSLVGRVRRLIEAGHHRAELFPGWMAGVATLGLMMSAWGATRLADATPLTSDPFVQGSTQDTVILHPGDGPLADRWGWAFEKARELDIDVFWIGYAVESNPELDGWIFMDRDNMYRFNDISIRGRFIGRFDGITSPGGTRLGPIVGERPPDYLAIMFGFAVRSGTSVLSRVRLNSFFIPVSLEDQALIWLGDAASSESVPIVRDLFEASDNVRLRDDLVTVVGAHYDDTVTIPVLVNWLQSDEHPDVRAEAADWLGYQSKQPALYALTRAAHGDPSSDVRREAAEAVGHHSSAAATDSLIALAQELTDHEARREAVEALGERDDQRSLDALVTIASQDRSQDVQREAVEALGEFSDGRGLAAISDIAETHPDREVRREALETIGEAMPPEEARAILEQASRQDPDPDVQREAVEALGELEGEEAIELLLQIAQQHPNREVQRQAVETLGEVASSERALEILSRLAESHPVEEVQREAVSALTELGDARAATRIAEIARTHRSSDVRREAVEAYAEIARPEEAVQLLSEIARNDNRVDVQREAVERLGELDTPEVVSLLRDIAENHPNSDVQREAVETLGETLPAASALDALTQIAERHSHPDVQREAVEALGELRHPQAQRHVAEIARRHPHPDVRHEAVETYAEIASPDSAAALLAGLVASDRDRDVQEEALEALVELRDGAGIEAVIEIARTHPVRDIRVRAVQLLAESDHPRAIELIRRMLREP